MKNAEIKPMTINGFTFRIDFTMGVNSRRYEACRGEVVLKSKSLDYLIRKVKKYPKAA
jgi:hypothetical protein